MALGAIDRMVGLGSTTVGRGRTCAVVALAVVAALLAGCTSIGTTDPLVSHTPSTPSTVLSGATSPAIDPEHDRIVAS